MYPLLGLMHLLQWSSFGLKGTAKRVNANIWDNPFPDHLEALWSRANASQLFLHPPEEEVVHWSRIWQKGGGGCWHYRRQDDGRGGDRSMIPVKKLLLDEPWVVFRGCCSLSYWTPHRQRWYPGWWRASLHHIGGKSVDNVSSPLDFPCTEIVPVVSGFISFHLHGDIVN